MWHVSSRSCVATLRTDIHLSLTYLLTYLLLSTARSIQTRGGSRILQRRVSNPSERGTGGRAPKVEHFPGILYFQIFRTPPIILTHVTGTKQFFGFRRNSWRQASYDI